ncbi:hypothetical protein Tco_1188043, partial [Tanacetum coccineum]
YQVDQNQSTRFEVSVPDQHQSKTFSEKEQDFEPLKLTTIADIQALLGATEDELNEDSNDDVFGNGYSLKEKNQVKTNKTEHGNEKRVKSQSQKSTKKSTKSKSKVKEEADIEELLNGPTRTHLMGQVSPFKHYED